MSIQSTHNVHLLVLIHGIWGNPSHLAAMHRIMKETRIHEDSVEQDGSTLHVLIPETNKDGCTYDGIDWGGERVAAEIFQGIDKLESNGKNVVRFSVTGYSLGGLLARYIVGILYQRNFFATVTPVNFNTVATPHIGLPRYPSFSSKASSFFGPRVLGRTGEQLYGTDKWSKTGKALLEVMADPEHVFYKGFKLFPHIRIYANAVNDLAVSYMTAYVDVEDPFLNHRTERLTVNYDDKYFPIIKSFSIPETPPPKRKTACPLTWEWFKSYRPPLPPRLQGPFPFNMFVLALLPIIFPAFICLTLVKHSIWLCRSRSRIKLLEAEDPSATQRLVHVFGQLERQVEDTIVVTVDDPPVSIPSPGRTKTSKESPRVTPAQRRMTADLNALLQLQKERVYIPDVRNSHSKIIARDNIESHKIGEGVLRHWADAFVI